jgi:hypothetical protein
MTCSVLNVGSVCIKNSVLSKRSMSNALWRYIWRVLDAANPGIPSWESAEWQKYEQRLIKDFQEGYWFPDVTEKGVQMAVAACAIRDFYHVPSDKAWERRNTPLIEASQN